MAPKDPDETPSGVDWGEFSNEKTHLDEVPALPEHEHETGPQDLRRLPGYEVGVARGVEEALTGFRLALIQDHTDPGVAFSLAERLRRWMAMSENRKMVRAVLE